MILWLLACLSIAAAPEGRWHDVTNHLALWTQIDDHTQLDTIGREIVIDPKRRSEIVRLSDARRQWRPGDGAKAVGALTAQEDDTLEIRVDERGNLIPEGVGFDKDHWTEPLAEFFHVYPDRYLGIATDGTLMVFERRPGNYYGQMVYLGVRRELAPLLGDVGNWQIEVNNEQLSMSGGFKVTKLYFLEPDSDEGYVFCVLWKDTDLELFAARVRFAPHEAQWPDRAHHKMSPGMLAGLAEAENDGVMSRLPPFYLEAGRAARSGPLSELRLTALAGAGTETIDFAAPYAPTFMASGQWKHLYVEGHSSMFRRGGRIGTSFGQGLNYATLGLVTGVWGTDYRQQTGLFLALQPDGGLYVLGAEGEISFIDDYSATAEAHYGLRQSVGPVFVIPAMYIRGMGGPIKDTFASDSWVIGEGGLTVQVVFAGGG